MGFFSGIWDAVLGPRANRKEWPEEKIYEDPRGMDFTQVKGNLEGVRVYMAEDEKDLFTAFRFIFEDEGCVCGGIGDVNSFDLPSLTEEIVKFKPDVIFIDHYLPGIKTDDLILSLKTKLPNCPPIIVIAPRAKEVDVQSAHKAGASEFLVAPFEPAKLLYCTHEVMQKHMSA